MDSLGSTRSRTHERKQECVSTTSIKRGRTSVTLRQALHNVVEGSRAWGVIDVPNSMSRAGWDRYSLTVFPPGTNVAERRALTFVRRWPLWGAMFLLLLEMTIGAAWPSVPVAIALVVLYLAGVGYGLTKTSKLRRRVRRLHVAVVSLGGGIQVIGNRALFERSVEALEDLDQRMREGSLEPAQYEAGWGAVYDELDP